MSVKMPAPIIRKLPPMHKYIEVSIDDSITDDDILGIVSAIVSYKASMLMKHQGTCMQTKVEQELIVTMSVDMSEEFVAKGLAELLLKLVDFQLLINKKAPLERDFHHVFYRDDIIALAKPSNRAFAQAAGILIGVECNSVFDISKAVEGMEKEFSNIATIVGTIENHKLSDTVAKFCAANDLISEVLCKDSIYTDMLQQVVNSSIVIGRRSFYTTAAACLEIPCIEIFESRDELNMFSKWSSLRYAAVLKDEMEFVNIERLYKIWNYWKSFEIATQDSSKILMTADG